MVCMVHAKGNNASPSESPTMRALRLALLCLLLLFAALTPAPSSSEDDEDVLDYDAWQELLDENEDLEDVMDAAFAANEAVFGDDDDWEMDDGEDPEAPEPPGGSTSAAGARKRKGRPPKVEIDVDEFTALVLSGDWQNQDLANHYGVGLDVIKKLKKKLKLTKQYLTVPDSTELPSYSQFQQLWLPTDGQRSMLYWPVTVAIAVLASYYGVTPRRLRDHMRSVGFQPKNPTPYPEVRAAVENILSSLTCSDLGWQFVDARLRTEYNIVAREALIRKALRELSPGAQAKRKGKAVAMKREYRVAGPRSMYHMDGHEKLAKNWGMWIHGCIDGYSRFIIYLVVAPDKFAQTVLSIFLDACDDPAIGWSSRVRADKGSENRDVLAAQVEGVEGG